jgi:hypothetical protein
LVRWSLLVLVCACRIAFDPRDNVDGGIDDIDTQSTTTLTFGERPRSMRKLVTSDAYIDEGMPAMNRGTTDDISVSRYNTDSDHGLVRFDVSSLLPGSRISAARLHVVRIDYGDESLGPIEVSVLGESWVEGTGGVGNGVSWTTRDGQTAWQTAGGTRDVAVATVTPTTMAVTFELPAAVVQSWIDMPATNAGLMLSATVAGTHLHVVARESGANADSRPELAVDVID